MTPAPIGRTFVLGGRAIFTATGKAATFTFKVRRADPTPRNPDPDLFFIQALTPDGYRFLGILDPVSGAVRPTRYSKLSTDDLAFQAASWLFPRLWHFPDDVKVQLRHVGRCGRCAAVLPDQASIDAGFGPECQDKIGHPIRKADVAKTDWGTE